MQNITSFLDARRLWRLLKASLIITILLAGAFVSSVSYADGGQASFTLNPVTFDPTNPLTRAYFILDAGLGSTLQQSISVTNSGTAKGTVNLYTVDAATGQTSGLVYLSQQDARRDVGAWITLSEQQLTLAPGESKIVPFQVNIPFNIRAGQHVGGIVAEDASQKDAVSGQAVQIKMRRRTVTAVQINIAGTLIEQLEAKGIQAGGANNYQTVQLGLSNTGNMMLKPSGELQIFDDKGQLLQDRMLQLDTLLPDTTISYPIYVQHKALTAGNYSAKLYLQYGHAHSLSYNTRFTVTPEQVAQTFSGSAPLQAPDMGSNFFASLTPWHYGAAIVLLLLLGSSLLYWIQKLRRLVLATRQKEMGKQAEKSKE